MDKNGGNVCKMEGVSEIRRFASKRDELKWTMEELDGELFIFDCKWM